MPLKYRVLSFHHITNNGAFLFAHTLSSWLQAELHPAEVKILDYKSPRLHLAENIKRFKIFQSIPLFYARRSQLWRELLASHLELDEDYPHFWGPKKLQRYLAERFDGLIVGMDVWCLTRGTERPTFPNIYWLPEKIAIPKIAYGVSAYNSDAALIHRNREMITTYLNDFTVIGSRDRFTHDMVQQYRTRPDGLVEKVPDPAFLYSIQPTGVKQKLARMGIDFKRPILGILLFGDRQISAEIQKHYHAKGYQILALSMYNPIADFNLGHLLTP
ncbi:MAG: polysaccharide pyruvyl transferase family protein, partial [Anaerolineales bacterium]|nr:polysaccharide pyruvyl transferase family protein [Anaerolineales bacterium]